jgi:hypothetical protein
MVPFSGVMKTWGGREIRRSVVVMLILRCLRDIHSWCFTRVINSGDYSMALVFKARG